MNRTFTPLYIDKLKLRLANFLFIVHQWLGLEEPTSLQYEICDCIQYGSSRQLIMAFRGCGKSHILAVYSIWLLFCDPTQQILVVSATNKRARAFTDFCQRVIIGMEILRHMKPTEKVNWTKECFTVSGADISQTDSLTSIGLTGQITGKRATVIIADDIESLQNSLNQDTRESLINATNEFQSVIIPDRPNKIVFLGTPQSKNSVYNDIQIKGYDRTIWTAHVPDPHEVEYYCDDLADSIQEAYNRKEYNTPTEPKRFPKERLDDIFKTYGLAGYNLQFMLNTTELDKERYPLDYTRLIVNDKITHQHTYEIVDVGGASGNMIPYSQIVLCIDPSGSGADKTGYVVLGQWSGYIAILEAGTFDNGYEDATMNEFQVICNVYGINMVIVEQNFGAGTYTQLLQKSIRVANIEEVRNFRQKEIRIIDTLEPVLLQNQLIIHKNVYNELLQGISSAHNLFYQMNNITRERNCLEHDDILDALAMGVAYLKDTLVVDAQRTKVLRDDEVRQRHLDAFIESAARIHGGGSSGGFFRD